MIDDVIKANKSYWDNEVNKLGVNVHNSDNIYHEDNIIRLFKTLVLINSKQKELSNLKEDMYLFFKKRVEPYMTFSAFKRPNTVNNDLSLSGIWEGKKFKKGEPYDFLWNLLDTDLFSSKLFNEFDIFELMSLWYDILLEHENITYSRRGL